MGEEGEEEVEEAEPQELAVAGGVALLAVWRGRRGV